MPNKERDGKAICPFYETSDRQWIRCECVIGGARLNHIFPTNADAEEYLRRYCDSYDYVQCRYCALLCQMYEGTEDTVEH